MLVLLIASLLSVTVAASNFESADRALSIVSLAISLPHGLLLRDHSRSLDFLQTSYLILSSTHKNLETPLDYSVLSFMPSFIHQ